MPYTHYGNIVIQPTSTGTGTGRALSIPVTVTVPVLVLVGPTDSVRTYKVGPSRTSDLQVPNVLALVGPT